MKHLKTVLFGLALTLGASGAWAEKKYDPGASDTEIKIGQIGPYSGPASAYGAIGKTIGAYFDKVNAEGGINGRKIKYVPLDDGYNPARAVEDARKLVEEDEVLLIFNPLGTPSNTAIEKYMNAKKVPQLFVATGATKFGNPANHWTMGWQPPYAAEGRIYAQHILETNPNAKIAVLYQNDDFGKDYLAGFMEGLGAKAKSMIVKEATYEVTDPTLDSQMLTLKASGADTFLDISTPKFAAMSIKKAAEIGWKPQTYLTNVSISVSSVMTPAGLQNGVGIITALYGKDPTDPQWANDPAMKDWTAFMKQYYPSGSLTDANSVYGYSVAQTMVQVLKQCGDDLTRANVMKQAANLNITLPMSLPGVNVQTSPTDYFPIEREQLARFDGKTWVLFGKVYGR
ncbi:MAG: branched-chain amino acid ABC transporter substrate-binding protein [Rubrivivax sp. SCN 70-15]|nr:MAG: branched-chain amino acid ABC transporter substrate-binding protein [Rubrivivax sp. SCN 70-15]